MMRNRAARQWVGAFRISLVSFAALTSLLSLLLPVQASAFIPDAKRILREITSVNRSSGRTQALQLDLSMRLGDREPIAEGQLITHPAGLARLELRGLSGRLDRYVLSGTELMGAKDGQPIDQPQPLLQPLFLMQPSSETTLRAALSTFGVETSLIGLATCGEQDCFVFGDPRLALGAPDGLGPGAQMLSGPTLFGTGFGAGSGKGPGTGLGERAVGASGGMARFWVDTKELQVRRIDREDGVFMLFGPMVSFAKIKVPAWLEIHEPGAPTVRFDIERAVQVNAPPTAFSQQWLMGLPADYQHPAATPELDPISSGTTMGTPRPSAY